MKDPYKVLEVSKTASAEDIKRSYRKLAKELHPDLNPGNEKAAARFSDVSQAYDLLSDPDKRKRFDAGEIDVQHRGVPKHRIRLRARVEQDAVTVSLDEGRETPLTDAVLAEHRRQDRDFQRDDLVWSVTLGRPVSREIRAVASPADRNASRTKRKNLRHMMVAVVSSNQRTS